MQNDANSIFRIPGLFKMHNEQAYTPYKFSIGPWHFVKTQLLGKGRKLKESFLERLISRFPNPAAKKSELEEAIKSVYDEARECYEGGDVYDEVEKRDVTREEFEKILLLDGCFIIELFRKNAEQVHSQAQEVGRSLGGMMQVIYHDLLLLDNQIPWFVLQLLFDETRNYGEDSNFTLVMLATEFFKYVLPCSEPQLLRLQPSHGADIIHLVDFVWRFWDVSLETETETVELYYGLLDYGTLIPSATRLKEAGVKFQKAASRNVLDVRFNKGVLEIPRLRITPLTETIFRNLIIFEQFSVLRIPRVTCYAVLLDCLVDTSDDVDLMIRAGIFDNRLNPQETANFLNRVRDNTFTQEFYYARLRKDVNRYCERRWPRWRASLIENYFTRPWAIVSVVFATIILFFTIMQVFYK